jgi:hypothetical protein
MTPELRKHHKSAEIALGSVRHELAELLAGVSARSETDLYSFAVRAAAGLVAVLAELLGEIGRMLE